MSLATLTPLELADCPPYLGYPHLSRLLGLTRKGIARMVERNDLPRPILIGNRCKWRREAIAEALRRLEERAAQAGGAGAA